jgi:phosphodiesterase/alkaline phosphatase D-like protein
MEIFNEEEVKKYKQMEKEVNDIQLQIKKLEDNLYTYSGKDFDNNLPEEKRKKLVSEKQQEIRTLKEKLQFLERDMYNFMQDAKKSKEVRF